MMVPWLVLQAGVQGGAPEWRLELCRVVCGTKQIVDGIVDCKKVSAGVGTGSIGLGLRVFRRKKLASSMIASFAS